jgi:lipopolysaccharide assembly protein A
MSYKVIAFLLFSLLMVIFTVQNQILIDIKFLKWEITDVPLAVILLSGLVFGFSLALIMQLPRIMKLKRELRKVVIELKKSEEIVAAKDEEITSEGVTMGSDYKGGFFTE